MFDFDKQVTRYKRVADFLEQFSQFRREDPKAAEIVLDALNDLRSGSGSPSNGTRTTHYDTIETFFSEHDNQWASIEDIATGTDLSVNSVRQVVYKANPTAFDKRSDPEHGRRKQLRILSLASSESEDA